MLISRTGHFRSFLLACCAGALLLLPLPVFADSTSTPDDEVTAYDMINGINAIRIANGLPALIVNGIIMNVAQVTAETMAKYNMTGHIGGVRERIAAAGYGVGDTVWATENFVMGPLPLENIIGAWGDDLHMKPMIGTNYCDIGAGVATAGDGTVYYVIQAAYTDYHACGPISSSTVQAGSATTTTPIISQYIYPVLTATLQPDGSLLHIVQYGQTAWSIAEAYSVTLEDLINYNYYLTDEDSEVYVGQHIYIPVDKMQTRTPSGNDHDGSITGTPGNENGTIIGTPAMDSGLTATYEVEQMIDRAISVLSASAASPKATATEPPEEQTDPVRGTRRLIVLTVVGGVFLILFGYYTKYR